MIAATVAAVLVTAATPVINHALDVGAAPEYRAYPNVLTDIRKMRCTHHQCRYRFTIDWRHIRLYDERGIYSHHKVRPCVIIKAYRDTHG